MVSSSQPTRSQNRYVEPSVIQMRCIGYSNILAMTDTTPHNFNVNSGPSPNPPPSGNPNGEEAYEGHGYGRIDCEANGNGSCCLFNGGECLSKIGVSICENAKPPPTPNPPSSGHQTREEACEGQGYGQSQCKAISDGICCLFDSDSCWSKISRNICEENGNPPRLEVSQEKMCAKATDTG